MSALGFSFLNVVIRKSAQPGESDTAMFFTTLFSVAALSPAAALVVAAGDTPGWSTAGVLWFVAAGVLASFLGRAALFAGIGYVGSSRAAAVKNTAPIVTVVVAIVFLGERLSALGTVGVGLTFLGLLLLCLEAFQRHRADRKNGEDEGVVDEDPPSECLEEDDAGERAGRLSVTSYVMSGTLSSVLAAAFFGLGQAARKVGIDHMPNALLGATIASWTALIVYLVVSAARGRLGGLLEGCFGKINRYLLLAGLAVTVGQLGFFVAITYASVSYVSTVAASETLLTVFLAAIFIGRSEAITRRVVLAAVAVFAGAAIIALS